MDRKTQSTAARPSLTAYAVVAAIAAAAGFGAVYSSSKAPVPGDPVAAGEAQPAAKTAGAGLAAFVRKATPEPLAEVTFQGRDGAEIKLSSFKGKTVLLNLWATWCAPCRKEMPSLDRLQKELGSDKFEVVALAVDRAGVEAADKFLAETKVEHLKLYADATTRSGTALRALGLPTTILIGKDGREIGRLAGPAEWDSAQAKALIEAALK